MRVVAPWLVLVAAALPSCGPPPAPREVVPSHRTTRPTPGRAAPRVVFPGTGPEGYENVGLEGLPAVGASGEVAVVGHRDSDGGRGYPNLELRLVDRGDIVLERLTVLTSDEWETFALDETGPSPAFRERLDAANAWLARMHERHALAPMAPLQLTGEGQGDDTLRELSGGGLVVRWARSQLTLEGAGTRRVLDRPAWEAGRGATCAQCPPCENPSFLAGGYHAPGIRLVVVELAFHGTDLCWEPGNALHVVTW